MIVKENKNYFGVIQNNKLRPGIFNTCRMHTLTSGTKSIKDTLIWYIGREKAKQLYLLAHGEGEINL